ncbi:Fe-S oxidoreductase [Desulfosporosinus orientis DSM 765]|uniref:Fe-S oxidoreductase n=1 Tax=Desulfosporosinus orientis (strain ATCC 19365 / DSM 765 / NCIMB 8382 / VKM B-1628 / Singapore I) TaxID=768706 RepID=G7WHL2_DESOD|nr:radical SAM protein [Desulfosporosinus orientis]AET70933.1 Fe-S oxidoreductase [Desulfosporosinus orientis DSM 765]
MFYEGTIYRPPSEAKSLILQISVGCKHNACTFCTMYKDKKFRIKSRAEITEIINAARDQDSGTERIFLADGDAIAVDTPLLIEILDRLYNTFPQLKRVGIYGGPKDILAKSPKELADLKEHGLHIVYLGVESGNEEILQAVCKGVTADQMIAAGQKVKASGLTLSCTIIIGLGGKTLSQAHAMDTARVVSEIDPEYLGALTLMLEPDAPLAQAIREGSFQLLNPFESLIELRTLLAALNVSHCVFRSNHASNYLPLRATLPEDRRELLETMDHIINNRSTERLRPEYWRGL